MENNIDFKRAYERQKRAREMAEDILENRSRELFEKNQASIAEVFCMEQKFRLCRAQKKCKISKLEKFSTTVMLSEVFAHIS